MTPTSVLAAQEVGNSHTTPSASVRFIRETMSLHNLSVMVKSMRATFYEGPAVKPLL
jgi:hypothetical protein